ncbi:MAG: hypothetical protein RL754_376 [Bacteroidota bacterium]|jgi:hypothetical protein
MIKRLLSSGLLLCALNVQAQEQPEGAILHHVFFWLNNPGSAADAAHLKEGLRTLESIPEVQKLLLGAPASTMKREVVVNDWDVSELMFFKSSEDQDAYQEHPIHKAFVEKYNHLWKEVVVYDMRVD